MAHDLNQSLALIAGYGELLQQTLDERPTAVGRLREMTEVMVRAASDGGGTVLDGDRPVLDGDRPALGGEVPAAGRADRAARAARAAFDLPYGRLPAAARRLFRLQSLVPGPDLSADGAAAVAGVTPAGAARLLDRLTAAHLVEEGTAGRYA